MTINPANANALSVVSTPDATPDDIPAASGRTSTFELLHAQPVQPLDSRGKITTPPPGDVLLRDVPGLNRSSAPLLMAGQTVGIQMTNPDIARALENLRDRPIELWVTDNFRDRSLALNADGRSDISHGELVKLIAENASGLKAKTWELAPGQEEDKMFGRDDWSAKKLVQFAEHIAQTRKDGDYRGVLVVMSIVISRDDEEYQAVLGAIERLVRGGAVILGGEDNGRVLDTRFDGITRVPGVIGVTGSDARVGERNGSDQSVSKTQVQRPTTDLVVESVVVATPLRNAQGRVDGYSLGAGIPTLKSSPLPAYALAPSGKLLADLRPGEEVLKQVRTDLERVDRYIRTQTEHLAEATQEAQLKILQPQQYDNMLITAQEAQQLGIGSHALTLPPALAEDPQVYFSLGALLRFQISGSTEAITPFQADRSGAVHAVDIPVNVVRTFPLDRSSGNSFATPAALFYLLNTLRTEGSAR